MPTTTANPGASQPAARLQLSDCRVEDLAVIVQVDTRAADYPLASSIARGIVLYDCATLCAKRVDRDALMAEWARVWREGPGVLVLKNVFEDLGVLNRVSAHFQAFIEEGRKSGTGADHFAKPGANDRVWNALEKLCVAAPEDFAAYYGNTMLALACEAWLGPAYQMTSQVNCVNPGGAAQMPHRDYHLGFLTPEQAARFPIHVHALSPFLTLQGAVAHVDMPLESGPTLYLPHSQKYLAGYLVAGHPEFQQFFEQHHVQLPLEKGDAVFFNPALMHAAGANRTSNVYRLANLLQISSAFGRAMESADRVRMSHALYPALLKMQAAGALDAEQMQYAVAACAEGYAFPTNLDRDPPLGGLAPESQQAMMLRALHQRWAPEVFNSELQAQAGKKLTTNRNDL
jgi:ectoine hydroxylase-related dioxygenase (phytanoyl-CoA dioxygenase family)